eukprot:scaffold566_cov364-Pavlova_lutheri.AAC.40
MEREEGCSFLHGWRAKRVPCELRIEVPKMNPISRATGGQRRLRQSMEFKCYATKSNQARSLEFHTRLFLIL